MTWMFNMSHPYVSQLTMLSVPLISPLCNYLIVYGLLCKLCTLLFSYFWFPIRLFFWPNDKSPTFSLKLLSLIFLPCINNSLLHSHLLAELVSEPPSSSTNTGVEHFWGRVKASISLSKGDLHCVLLVALTQRVATSSNLAMSTRFNIEKFDGTMSFALRMMDILSN